MLLVTGVTIYQQHVQVCWLCLIDFRTQCVIMNNDVNKITPTPYHLRYFKNLDKIDTFLKPVLNICIVDSFIIRW